MASDDEAYHKSVRNMTYVLAAIVIIAFAAVLIPPYIAPSHSVFQRAVSLDSPFGFALQLTVNTTSTSTSSGVLVEGWLNSTSASLVNITAADQWPLGSGNLWTKPCTSGWPIGLGIMKGHYDSGNYSLGTLVPFVKPPYACPVQASVPRYYLLEPRSSRALVDIGGSPQYWTLQSIYTFEFNSSQSLPPGIYTVILADEWGDVLTTNFRAT